MLDTTEQSVTSALKRARATLAEDLPSPDARPAAAELPRRAGAGGPPGRGVRGGRRGRHRRPDDRGRLAADAARAAGVPGPRAGRQVPLRVAFREGRRYRLVPTRANGQPAFGIYLRDPTARSRTRSGCSWSRSPATGSARSPASTTPPCRLRPPPDPGRLTVRIHPAAWLLLPRCSARSGCRPSRRQSSPADAWPASARSPSAWPPAGLRPASRFVAAAWSARCRRRAGRQHRPFQAATIMWAASRAIAGELQAALGAALLKDVLQPALVLVEEPDHRVSHRLWKGLVLGCGHAAQAHLAVAQHLQVQVHVGGQLAARAGSRLPYPASRSQRFDERLA